MKRTTALLLAILMILALLAGCSGGNTGSGSSSSTPTPASGTNGSENNTPAADDGGSGDNGDSEEYVYRMPIADNYTLSWWTVFSSTILSSPEEKKCYQEMERRTGVHIDWQLAASSNSSEAFNLMVMSQEYTDLINAGQGTYTGGMDKAIDDGVYLRLNEWVEKWAPNFVALMNRDDATRRQQLTDEDNIAYFGSIQNPQPAWIGPMVRQDWLEADGLSTPETYDDWHEMLVSFRDNHNAVMALGYQGYNPYTQSTNGGFDVGIDFYNENGTIKYGPIEDGFLGYLTLMNQWYNEGLIDPDFYTRVSETFGVPTDMIVSGAIGVFDYVYTMPHMLAALSGDPNYHAKAIPAPVMSAGDVSHFRRVNFELGNAGTVITPGVADDLEKLEIAVRYMDYRYTDEGSELLNYGILGESYEYDENGEPQYLPYFYNNPDGLSFSDATQEYREMTGGQFYRWELENITVSEEELEAYDIWNAADGAWILPPVTMTTAEGQEYSSIYTDIETYVIESVPNFIIGTKPLSDWDSFVAQIKSMNIDRCIEIYQAALDRYNNR